MSLNVTKVLPCGCAQRPFSQVILGSVKLRIRSHQPIACRNVNYFHWVHSLLIASFLLQKSTVLCHRSKSLTAQPMMSPLATMWWTSVCHPPPMDRNPISCSAARTCDCPAPCPSVRARPRSLASPSPVSSRPSLVPLGQAAPTLQVSSACQPDGPGRAGVQWPLLPCLLERS